ncbi:phosducin-like protein [Clytia hemisphaerica]|uniref:phosducin-like protein n=1 Tax=Clytia hemisphaerica TaxID=252671 RepID=UPI0034D7A53D
MADLDSKLTGDKTASYVSDSDGEDSGPLDAKQNDMPAYDGPQTGPKGVLEDYKQYKNLCKIEDNIATKEKIEYHKKTAFTADPNKHTDEVKNENSDDEFDFEDDEFLKEYHQKRLEQMQTEMENKIKLNMTKFGQLFDLQTSDELLNVIENEDKSIIVIVHLCDESVPGCIKMNECLDCLAKQYSHVKFCKISATKAGLSLQFKLSALPALQVYKAGTLIGNYIKMLDHLDKIFYTADVENFFIENDIIPSVSSMRNNYDDFDILDEE